MAWRLFCALVGFVAGACGVAGLAFAFTPAFALEPTPGLAASLAVIAILVSGRFLWWAFAPARKDR